MTFLFPRPFMERLGFMIDYGRKKLQWDDSPWTRVHQRSGGHFLLDLAEGTNALRKELQQPAFFRCS